MKKIATAGFAMFCLASMISAQNNTILEPGQNEGATTVSKVEVPKTWSHPKEEARGIWLTAKEFLVPQSELEKRYDDLKAANINAVFLNVWFRGFVVYPGSDIVEQYKPAKELADGDPLKVAITEAKKRGFKVHAWPEYGFYAYHTMDAKADKSRGPLLDKHPELTAVSASGQEFIHNPVFGDYYSFCPSNPKSHQILADIYTEVLTKYDFEGLNLDRIRYPANSYCHCGYCKSHFKKDTGIELTADISETSGAKAFLNWKREQTAAATKLITQQVKKAHPKLPITAYVVGPDEMDDKAQSWDLWMQRGYLDAISVSMYGANVQPEIEKVFKKLGPHKDKLIAAINAGVPSSNHLLRNLGTVREHIPLGQFIWYAGNIEDDYSALINGPYAKPSEWPELKK